MQTPLVRLRNLAVFILVFGAVQSPSMYLFLRVCRWHFWVSAIVSAFLAVSLATCARHLAERSSQS